MLELARSPLPFRLHVHELIPNPEQYPPDWDDWKVDQERSHPDPREASVEKIPFDPVTKSWPLFDEQQFAVCAGILIKTNN